MAQRRSRSAQWVDALEQFRAAASPLHAAYVADNSKAMRIVAIWPHQVIERAAPKGAPPKDWNRVWIWLWECVTWDQAELAGSAGLHPDVAGDIMRALIGSRAIYPDGTLCPQAEQVVKLHLAAKLRSKRPPKEKLK